LRLGTVARMSGGTPAAVVLLVDHKQALVQHGEQCLVDWGKVVFERRGEFLRLQRWRCEHDQRASGRAAMVKGNSGGAPAFPFIAVQMRERVWAA
ncbi:hypothetical protein KFY34_28105, partial [Salmonella enterica subsp. enterica serovar 1,4,[5],12:i:-]|nr:hypothetical protein [Salmonella enterica subsp. enterica serovar 1,4,[5],12:i:-]